MTAWRHAAIVLFAILVLNMVPGMVLLSVEAKQPAANPEACRKTLTVPPFWPLLPAMPVPEAGWKPALPGSASCMASPSQRGFGDLSDRLLETANVQGLAERTDRLLQRDGAMLVCQMMQADSEKLPLPTVEKKKRRGDPSEKPVPCLTWIDPDVPLKGLILCVHGLGLHKGCYEAFAKRMAPLGWGIYAIDVRGFGSFQEMPGVKDLDFKGAVEDVRRSLEFIRAAHPGKPVFLLGESMGGAISLRVTSMYPELIDGLISSVPAGDRFHMLKDSVKVGMNLIVGGARKTMDVAPIVVDRSTEKEDVRERWKQDPMARFQLSPMDLIHFQKLCDENVKCAKRIKDTPVLIMHGLDDKLVKQKGSADVLDHIASKDSMLVWVDKSEHLLFEEAQFNDGIINTVCEWLDNHIKPTN